MSHPTERFARAVQTLVEDGPVKQRLVRAFTDHLEDLPDTALPTGLRSPFTELKTALCRLPPVGKEHRVRTNVQKMSVSEAREHAVEIVALYAELLLHTERAEPLKVVSSAKKPPRYLTGR